MVMDAEKMRSEADAARLLGLKQRVLADLRAKGIGPDHVKVGRFCYYPQQGLDVWVEQQTQRGPLCRPDVQYARVRKFWDLPEAEEWPALWSDIEAIADIYESKDGGQAVSVRLPGDRSIYFYDMGLHSSEDVLEARCTVELLRAGEEKIAPRIRRERLMPADALCQPDALCEYWGLDRTEPPVLWSDVNAIADIYDGGEGTLTALLRLPGGRSILFDDIVLRPSDSTMVGRSLAEFRRGLGVTAQ